MNLRRLTRVLVLAAPCLAAWTLAPGCETTNLFEGDPNEDTPERGEWQVSQPLDAESFQDVWERAQATLELMDFTPDPDRTHYEEKVIVSKWLTRLAPFRMQGFRRRAHLEILPEGTRWVVRAAVLLQRNADIDNPSSPAQAQWEGVGVDANRSALLLYRIASAFDPEKGGVLAVPEAEKAPAK